MTKIEEVKKFLESVGMPEQQQADVCCLALLTLASIKPEDNCKCKLNSYFNQEHLSIA